MTTGSGPAQTRRQHILVVDDEEDIQILVCRILRDMGYEVDSARDGDEAIRKIDKKPPDLIILDLVMPTVDGWGVLHHLKTSALSVPVVVLTGVTDYAAFARGVQEGASAYVIKPFRFHELVATCQRILLAGGQRVHVKEERRRQPRRLLIVEVNVLSRDRVPIALGELVNLSMSGAQVELGVPLEPGDRVRVAFHIPGGVPVSLEGRVQWRRPAASGFAHGLEFVSLTDEDQRHLRELLEPRD